MPRYSEKSSERLSQCTDNLQLLFNTVIRYTDNSIWEGHRIEEIQNDYFRRGKSKVEFPNGKHNKIPSEAADSCAYPRPDFESKDKEIRKKAYWEQCVYAGKVIMCAAMMGIKIRWGGDWDMDKNLQNNNFDDLVHFEELID